MWNNKILVLIKQLWYSYNSMWSEICWKLAIILSGKSEIRQYVKCDLLEVDDHQINISMWNFIAIRSVCGTREHRLVNIFNFWMNYQNKYIGLYPCLEKLKFQILNICTTKHSKQISFWVQCGCEQWWCWYKIHVCTIHVYTIWRGPTLKWYSEIQIRGGSRVVS